MAQVSVSVAETVRTFGGAPSSLWNVYSWNAFKWGEGTASMVVGAFVGVAETGPAATSDVANAPAIAVAEAFAPAGALASGSVRDAAGYYHVFPAATTDGEQRDTPAWTAGSATTPTWTSAAVSATSWS